MPVLFNVTFERVTPESAKYGEVESRGFLAKNVCLRDAVYEVCGFSNPRNLSYCESDSYPIHAPRWFTFYNVNEGTRDAIETGAEESRSIHVPDSVTPPSRMRLARLFRCYGA